MRVCCADVWWVAAFHSFHLIRELVKAPAAIVIWYAHFSSR
jgi:hypothetical protein